MKNLGKVEKRAKRIDRAIRLAIDSLQTHLPYTHSNSPQEMKEMGVRRETPHFHKKCVREYAQVIHDLANLY